jgi:ABC-type dipeptide/oligopeptide/nickel transport system ATPase subunit
MNAITRVFEDKPAVREKVPLLIGLMGPSGSGKTFSALRLATGIQAVSGGEIYFIDTEAKRGLHYADRFKYRHMEFGAPFGSLDYLAAITHCVKKGAGVVVVDSMSHEHDGPGGVLEQHEQELDRMAGQDYAKRNSMNLIAWAKPKAARRQLISGLLQLNCNFVFCFRAKEKAKPVKRDNRTVIENQGWMPIAGEEFVYEQTINCLLLPSSNGVPTWRSDEPGERAMMKLPEQFRPLFPDDRRLDEETGAAMAEWAAGVKHGPNAETLELARTAARGGSDVFDTWWKGATAAERRDAKTISEELKQIRAEADARQAEAEEDAP